MHSFCSIFISVMYHTACPFPNNAKCLIGTEVIYVHYYCTLLYSYFSRQINQTLYCTIQMSTCLEHFRTAMKFKLQYTLHCPVLVSHAFSWPLHAFQYCPVDTACLQALKKIPIRSIAPKHMCDVLQGFLSLTVVQLKSFSLQDRVYFTTRTFS